ncbi:MAG: AAA family ATPase [Comamonadaceae bacterium]|nr:MAG: AAA family ATPase [Comamonadaceae bacterium]
MSDREAKASSTATSTTAARLPPLFPFTAIAGQPALTEALLLAAADPSLGGVLVEGPRGTAKSTAARALAELLGGAPFTTLPLSASLEQLVGTLDLGAAIGGHALKFAPGLLARAHGGVLYVDEVNLLADGLVDVLLDAAASGVNVVERDGISHAHAARFVLVGTMNREEGELRPQLLDRFGLFVRLENIVEPAQRQAVVRSRLAFDADPEAFRARHAGAQAGLQQRLATARAGLSDPAALPVDGPVHELVSQLCIAAQVDGLRADLVMLRAARALAALEGAAAVTAAHVGRVAELVLAHRRGPDAPHASPQPTSGPSAAPPDVSPNPSSPDHRAADRSGASADATEKSPGADSDWGAMPAEAVGIDRVKPLRPLLAAKAGVATKKA